MPLALLVAFAGSLVIHAGALWVPELTLFGHAPEPPLRIDAELRPLPLPAGKPETPAASSKMTKRLASRGPGAQPDLAQAPVAVADPANQAEPVPAEVVAPPRAQAVLPATGVIRYAIYQESLDFQIGRAEQHWTFFEDGRYRLFGITETSGLAAWVKPLRLETESLGRLVAGGLQPEHYRVWKNGQDSRESADFVWPAGRVQLLRDGSEQSVAPGTQDLLSLNYQLAFLGRPAEGSRVGVVTGRKYERYELDALGEEELETPLGRFRTLHLRAMTERVTEIWIALDRQRLPVKIRFTDKKGDSYYQIVTEIGQVAAPPP